MIPYLAKRNDPPAQRGSKVAVIHFRTLIDSLLLVTQLQQGNSFHKKQIVSFAERNFKKSITQLHFTSRDVATK